MPDQAEIERLTDQLAAARAENARLLEVAQKEPHTAYLEAVQRACDERMVALKHAERDAAARAGKAERQLAEARAALANIARECSSFPIRDGLAFRCEGHARAALPDSAPAEGEG